MNRRLAALGAIAVALGGYLAADHFGLLTAMLGKAPPAQEIAAAGTEQVAKLNPLGGLEAASFPDVTARPLFNPSRQPRPAPQEAPPPPPVVEAPPPPPPPPPQGPGPEDYKLLGVASGPGGRVAAVRVAASGEVVYLRKGETVDSWEVIDVADKTVAIGTPGNAVIFAMFVNPNGDPSSPDAAQDGGQPPDPSMDQGAPPEQPAMDAPPEAPASEEPAVQGQSEAPPPGVMPPESRPSEAAAPPDAAPDPTMPADARPTEVTPPDATQ